MSKTGSGAAQRGSRATACVKCALFLAFTFLVGLSLFNGAVAQTASFRSVDTNSDGVLSLNELTAAFGESGARRLLEDIDRNGDDRITIIELRRGVDNGQGEKNERGEREGRENRSGRSGEQDGDDRDDDGDDRGDGGDDDRDDDD